MILFLSLFPDLFIPYLRFDVLIFSIDGVLCFVAASWKRRDAPQWDGIELSSIDAQAELSIGAVPEGVHGGAWKKKSARKTTPFVTIPPHVSMRAVNWNQGCSHRMWICKRVTTDPPPRTFSCRLSGNTIGNAMVVPYTKDDVVREQIPNWPSRPEQKGWSGSDQASF